VPTPLQIAVDRAGISVSQIAARIGVHRATVYRWLGAQAVPDAGQLGQLQLVLGLSADEVVQITSWYAGRESGGRVEVTS